jgi:hypothetical protein
MPFCVALLIVIVVEPSPAPRRVVPLTFICNALEIVYIPESSKTKPPEFKNPCIAEVLSVKPVGSAPVMTAPNVGMLAGIVGSGTSTNVSGVVPTLIGLAVVLGVVTT